MGPAEAKAASDLMQAIIGTKQLGAVAPAFQSGMMNFGGPSMMEPDTGADDDFIKRLMNTQPVGSVQDLVAQTPQTGEPLAAQVTANDVAGLPTLEGMAQQGQQAIGDPGMGAPQEEQGGLGGLMSKIGTGADNFLGNMDQNMQSPSKMLGLGLLGQLGPRAGMAGLLASGLFGDKKVF